MPRNAMPANLQDFRVLLPPDTHRDPATCREVDCPHYLGGWMTVVAVDSAQDVYIRNDSGREFMVTKVGDQVEYCFTPGQRCFRQHTKLNGREPYYIHETRDSRLVHQRGEDFIEHTHQEMDRHFRDKERG